MALFVLYGFAGLIIRIGEDVGAVPPHGFIVALRTGAAKWYVPRVVLPKALKSAAASAEADLGRRWFRAATEYGHFLLRLFDPLCSSMVVSSTRTKRIWISS